MLKLSKYSLLSIIILFFISISSLFLKFSILIFSWIFLLKEFLKNKIILLVFFLPSVLLLLTDIVNFFSYIIFSFSIVLFSSFANRNIKKFLKVYLYSLVLLLCVLLFFPQNESGNILDCLLFKERFFPRITDTYSMHPNYVGVISAIAAFLSLYFRKYLLFVLVFYFLLITQSRGAFLLFSFIAVFYFMKSLKKTLLMVFLTSIIIYIVSLTPVFDRLSDTSDNGRFATYAFYMDKVYQAFPIGYSIPQYLEEFEVTKAGLDNLYLLGFLSYGLIFVYFILILIFLLAKKMNKEDEFLKLRLTILFGFILHGFVEGSLLNLFIAWPFFAIVIPGSKNEAIK